MSQYLADIGTAVAGYYGREAGAKLTALLNPRHWPEATLRTAMYMHLDQTLAEATHRLKGDYAADVRDFDAIETHILVMADMLSRGIIAQFPSRFTGGTRAVAR